MKTIQKLVLCMMTFVLFMPFVVNAEKENKKEEKEPVKVYIFRSDNCGYCHALMEYMDSIEEEYGKYFDVYDYEVSDSENSQLYSEVAEYMGDDAQGVPYMVVGEYTYPNGFAADTIIDSESGQTSGDQLIERIMEIYNSDDRYDVMVEINNKPNYDIVVAVVAGIIIVGIVGMAIITRRS